MSDSPAFPWGLPRSTRPVITEQSPGAVYAIVDPNGHAIAEARVLLCADGRVLVGGATDETGRVRHGTESRGRGETRRPCPWLGPSGPRGFPRGTAARGADARRGSRLRAGSSWTAMHQPRPSSSNWFRITTSWTSRRTSDSAGRLRLRRARSTGSGNRTGDPPHGRRGAGRSTSPVCRPDGAATSDYPPNTGCAIRRRPRRTTRRAASIWTARRRT